MGPRAVWWLAAMTSALRLSEVALIRTGRIHRGAMRPRAAVLAVTALLVACQGSSGPPEVVRQKNGLLAVGSGLPPLKGTTLDGRVVTNADMAGKTVLVNTWFFE